MIYDCAYAAFKSHSLLLRPQYFDEMSRYDHEAMKNVTDSPYEEPDILVNIVDRKARHDPGGTYAEFPVSPTDFDEGYKNVSHAAFANAVNGAAWWLQTTLGHSKDFETVAYIGPNDLRYNIFVLGAVKAGYKVNDPNT